MGNKQTLMCCILGALLIWAGCKTMTADQCRAYVNAAKLAVRECDRIEDPQDAQSCRAAAEAALLIAYSECGRID
jgi:hypothetical protein